ncbi:hypothetical protein M758_6G206200 [Ceratodon purpureus]|uniref:Uncharacterized protein n=1 Tax=Ceratodon purpureus TaxID=3225 RepID=A0A8T0HK31_CERPU|nr:hypothetical protein KC19_6G215200 [Ceratodon purpureus]KAG0614823.1 hypothetical protein M758_6G206200 [Ceratodon purpureus]
MSIFVAIDNFLFSAHMNMFVQFIFRVVIFENEACRDCKHFLYVLVYQIGTMHHNLVILNLDTEYHCRCSPGTTHFHVARDVLGMVIAFVWSFQLLIESSLVF